MSNRRDIWTDLFIWSNRCFGKALRVGDRMTLRRYRFPYNPDEDPGVNTGPLVDEAIEIPRHVESSMLVVNKNLSVPLREFDFTFARSSGPGGQNVNKVNTKVTLRWSVTSTTSLPEPVRARLLASYARRINNEGDLLIVSQRFRNQGRNVADCLGKLRSMILSVAQAPKKRKATRPTRAAKERRLQAKQRRSRKKRLRRGPSMED